jgi:hypothetical protein
MKIYIQKYNGSLENWCAVFRDESEIDPDGVCILCAWGEDVKFAFKNLCFRFIQCRDTMATTTANKIWHFLRDYMDYNFPNEEIIIAEKVVAGPHITLIAQESKSEIKTKTNFEKIILMEPI